MIGGDNDYGDAFKEAKLEHDQRRQGSALQAEVDADAAALSNVVLPQLQAATEKLEPLGGRVEIRRYGRTGKSLRPTSVAFRITDQEGHQSRVYLRPRRVLARNFLAATASSVHSIGSSCESRP
jgi:hypothetical protein